MEGIKFVKIIFSISSLLLIIFFVSCQSPLFQTKYEAENDLLTNSQYYGQYISKNVVGYQNTNEKLNVFITKDVVTKEENGITTTATNSIYIWIGGSAFPTDEGTKFTVENSNVDGVYPHYAFNNNELVGKITIINNNVINITFATLFPPNINIQNLTCNKTNKTS